MDSCSLVVITLFVNYSLISVTVSSDYLELLMKIMLNVSNKTYTVMVHIYYLILLLCLILNSLLGPMNLIQHHLSP